MSNFFTKADEEVERAAMAIAREMAAKDGVRIPQGVTLDDMVDAERLRALARAALDDR